MAFEVYQCICPKIVGTVMGNQRCTFEHREAWRKPVWITKGGDPEGVRRPNFIRELRVFGVALALMRASSCFFGAPKTSLLLAREDLRSGVCLSSRFQVAAVRGLVARPNPRGADHVKSILNANPMGLSRYAWKPQKTQESPTPRARVILYFLKVLFCNYWI